MIGGNINQARRLQGKRNLYHQEHQITVWILSGFAKNLLGVQKINLAGRQIMKQTTYQVAFPVALVVVMVAFFSTIFLVNANPSFATSGDKKSAVVVRPSALDHTEASIKELQGALKITSEDVLWKNLTQVMRENAKEMDVLAKNRAENSKVMNAVERMKFHSEITEAHLSQQKKLIPHFEALYASMSDEQKKKTDILFEKGIFKNHKRK